MAQNCVVTLVFVQLFIQSAAAQEYVTPTGPVLPETEQLELARPLHEVMVKGISQFAERELQTARENRTATWLDAEDVEAAKEAARRRLRELIGAVDQRLSAVDFYNSIDSEVIVAADKDPYSKLIFQSSSKWSVLEGVSAEGFLFDNSMTLSMSKGSHDKSLIIYLPDPVAGQREHIFAKRFAIGSSNVIVPTLVDRQSDFSAHPDIRRTNMTHREYVYRTGFNLGRHIIGYEVQRILALLESNALNNSNPIILIGSGEGAVIAQYVAALAPDKIDAVVLHGYFGPRENVWQEPIYRNVWNQLSEFGDAEIASLIAPTPLIIEAGQAPEVSGPPEAKQGQANIAAPGIIKSPELAEVKKEFDRAKTYAAKAGHAEQLHLVENSKQICGPETIAILNKTLGLNLKIAGQKELEKFDFPEIDEEFLKAQQKRLVGELVRHTQMLLARADKVRAKLWKDVDRSSVAAWEKQAPQYREMVYNSFIGKIDKEPSAPNPRSRKVIDEPTHVGYEIMLDLYASEEWSEQNPGVIAGGILLLPKDLKKGEQRPVVVCQHGLEGTPMDTIATDESQRAFRAYKGFATQLVKRGFIVYAPQNSYKGYHDFRVIQRKSNPLGRSLFSYIIPQHQQTLNWLVSLNYVDPDRIAFYGLSYGGKTAVRVPPMLLNSFDDPSLGIPFRSGSFAIDHFQPAAGYCLSICSADFNEWIRKNASAEDRYSYVYTPEYEIFEWNMGHIANYAELSWLMAPRPFMVERGHDDGVAPDEWVGWEYAKVRRHYNKLGIGDQTEIEWFDGPHTINGDGTFKFLHRHLDWPERD